MVNSVKNQPTFGGAFGERLFQATQKITKIGANDTLDKFFIRGGSISPQETEEFGGIVDTLVKVGSKNDKLDSQSAVIARSLAKHMVEVKKEQPWKPILDKLTQFLSN
ncbi:MAG: hypothetical protein A2Y25_01450 [Candidatus Melainabacteria bacterium GWF2_37_15]|nr:MAG: hypothetical protein A2Y25_01450 [Candidatus Melainabacteria bacterium GWF2_37_15]